MLHPQGVAKALGIVGETNRFEVDLICFLKYTAQEARIQEIIDEKQELQAEALRKEISDMKSQIGKVAR